MVLVEYVFIMRVKLFKICTLEKGEYLSVSNDPGYFREGDEANITNENAVNYVVKLAGTDKWGYNRKNIISYLIETGNQTVVKIYGTYDNGNLIKRNSPVNPDNIVFNEKEFIKGASLPLVPEKMFIGDLSF